MTTRICRNCGHSIRRGWSGAAEPSDHATLCLVCATIRIMASFKMPRKKV
jgi:hypothetical protein